MYRQEGASCDQQDDVAKASVQGSIATLVLSKNLLLCNLHCNTRLTHGKDRPRQATPDDAPSGLSFQPCPLHQQAEHFRPSPCSPAFCSQL